jgi:MFS family permease
MAAVQPVASAPAPAPHPLRNAKFRSLWTGWSISSFGDQFYLVALPWLILQLTGSSVALGTILMAAAIPRAALMLMGGAIADRLSPRKIMIGTASSRTVFVAAIAALIWLHVLQLWHLYLLAFGFGVADAFAAPAGQAFLPSLVEPEQLVAANSLFQSTAQVNTIAGPAPAGFVIKAWGTAWAFFLDAVSFLFVIAALWRLPDPPENQMARKAGLLGSIVEGLKYVGQDIPLRSLMAFVAVLNFCLAGTISVGLAYLTKQRFASPAAYGLLVSSVGAGALAGSLAAGVIRQRRLGLMLLSVGAALGLCTASIGFLVYLWLLVGVLFLMGVGSGLVNVNIVAWFQRRVPREKLGRVGSVLMMAGVGLIPVSLALAGFMVEWSLVWMYGLAGAAILGAVLFAGMQRSVREIA